VAHRLSAAVAALCMLSAVFALGPFLGPAGATSLTSTEFQIAIVADAGPPVAGTRSYFYATLHSGTGPVSGVPVTLQGRSYGSTTFSALAHAVTDAYGGVSVTAVLRRTTALRWSYDGDSSYAGTVSHSYVQQVAPRVVAHAVDATLRAGQRVVVRGRTQPLKPGTRVSLWRGDRPAFAPDLHYVRIAVGAVHADGTFRLAAGFAHPGAARLYVKVNAGHGTTTGYSNYVRIRVR
jgi:hypothetical protein